MALVTSNARHGVKLYDIRPYLNIHDLRPDFNRLSVDPYVKEGFRRKHIARYRYTPQKQYVEMQHAPLFQSKDVNPTHGNLYRAYPKLVPIEPRLVTRALNLFVETAQVPQNETILLQYQRITTSLEVTGQPSVEGYHRDDVQKIGIICVARENVRGGINEFKLNTDEKDVIQLELPPGYMVVFDDNLIKHRVTEIIPEPPYTDGHRDVILLAYPAFGNPHLDHLPIN